MFTNRGPRGFDSFKTFEVAVMKRPSQGWQIGASYSSTWLDTAVGCNAAGTGLGSKNATTWYPYPVRHEPQPGLQHGQ